MRSVDALGLLTIVSSLGFIFHSSIPFLILSSPPYTRSVVKVLSRKTRVVCVLTDVCDVCDELLCRVVA